MRPLTTAEMAEHYKVSVKTFTRQVKEKKIPHTLIGRAMRFDLAKVGAYLEAHHPEPQVATFTPSVRKSRAHKSKFAEAVGI